MVPPSEVVARRVRRLTTLGGGAATRGGREAKPGGAIGVTATGTGVGVGEVTCAKMSARRLRASH